MTCLTYFSVGGFSAHVSLVKSYKLEPYMMPTTKRKDAPDMPTGIKMRNIPFGAGKYTCLFPNDTRI